MWTTGIVIPWSIPGATVLPDWQRPTHDTLSTSLAIEFIQFINSNRLAYMGENVMKEALRQTFLSLHEAEAAIYRVCSSSIYKQLVPGHQLVLSRG